MSEVLAHSLGNLAQVNKAIGHIDQLGSRVGAKAGNLNATAFVRDCVNGIDEVFIAGYEHGRVVAAGQRQHVHGNLHIEVGFARAVVESLEFLLHDAKTVAAHPKQKTLLASSARASAGKKE